MCLKIIPLPEMLQSLNPDWVLLVLIYWTLAIPEKIGVFNALVVGIFIDVLTGRLLGEYGLAYAFISYACLRLHKRLRQYPVPQQGMFIFCCLMFSQLMIYWIENLQAPTEFSPVFWLPVIVGTMSWPLVYPMLRFIRLIGRHY